MFIRRKKFKQMKIQSLKSVLRFWQEIVFVVPIVLLLIEITKWVMRSQTMDGWDIFLVCFMLPLLICIIGQCFWKNQTLAIILSVLLGLSCVTVNFMALYSIFNSPSYRTESIAMLIIGVVLVIAAFKMPAKYDPNKEVNFRSEVVFN